MSKRTVSDSGARRIARRVGLVARKSRWRKYSCDNFGDFMLVDPEYNACIAGDRFDMTAEEVVEYCLQKE
ncbi:MAG: hypothetical protein ACRESR_02115 [Gammaproteobacteria bacterium]